MRLLLSFILAFSSFLAPHKSDATGGVHGKKTDISASDSISKSGISAYSEYGHQLLTIAYSTTIGNATNKYRCFAGIHPDNSNLHGAPLAFLLTAKRLENAYSFCIPIGQKLLYPKHYFW